MALVWVDIGDGFELVVVGKGMLVVAVVAVVVEAVVVVVIVVAAMG